MKDCIFCKIVAGEISSRKEFETNDLLVIQDIKPKATIHLLIIAKEHVCDLIGDVSGLWAKIGEMAKEIAEKKNVSGFRLVHNAGSAALVKHLHVHFLGDVAVDREV